MMNKKYLFAGILIIILLLAAIVAGAFFYLHNNTFVEPMACTLEVKLCSDGSYVGREGSNCEFKKCPEPAPVVAGTIKGKVTVGPICPVEREGIPCPVSPEAYTSREVILYASNGKTIITSMHFLADGTYSFQVSAGTYILAIPKQGIGGSGDLPITIILKSGETKEVNFSIDTGIR